jgi:hypothetical protein
MIVYRPETSPLQVVAIPHCRRDVEELLRIAYKSNQAAFLPVVGPGLRLNELKSYPARVLSLCDHLRKTLACFIFPFVHGGLEGSQKAGSRTACYGNSPVQHY